MGQYIVLDLEWNQSPLGKDGSMDRLPFEIIEIGAVKLNASLQIISEFRRLIRPRVYRQMHFKISEVTHMSMDELNMEGEEFGKAMEEFLAWCGDDYKFCTWGSEEYGVPWPGYSFPNAAAVLRSSENLRTDSGR